MPRPAPTCSDCRHATPNWRDLGSDLPLCGHRAKPGGIWQLHATDKFGHCGQRRINFEASPEA
jgi:hypothetical protein